MSKKQNFLSSDNSIKAGLKEIAKILTNTEGLETQAKKDEIFQIVLSANRVKERINSFIDTDKAYNSTIFNYWVKANSVIDVIDLKHDDVDWCFVLKISRIPKVIYESVSPEASLKIAAMTIQQGLQVNTMHVYSDSRIREESNNHEPDKIDVLFLLAYKAGVTEQRIKTTA